jgi:hypothetical protein
MIAALLFTFAPGTPPTPSPGQIATPPSGALPQDPAAIARSQFIAFALDDVDASNYTDPPDREHIAAGKRLVLAAGRIKRIELLQRFDSRYGTGYAFRFVCDGGTLVERFTLKGGKITSIAFDKK